MTVGGGIALIVIGAILAFAFNLDNSWIDLHLIGYILMGAGVIVFLIGLIVLFRRRQSVATTHTAVDPTSGERVSRHVSEIDDSPLP